MLKFGFRLLNFRGYNGQPVKNFLLANPKNLKVKKGDFDAIKTNSIYMTQKMKTYDDFFLDEKSVGSVYSESKKASQLTAIYRKTSAKFIEKGGEDQAKADSLGVTVTQLEKMRQDVDDKILKQNLMISKLKKMKEQQVKILQKLENEIKSNKAKIDKYQDKIKSIT